MQGISQSAQAITGPEYFSLIVRDSGLQLLQYLRNYCFAHVSLSVGKLGDIVPQPKYFWIFWEIFLLFGKIILFPPNELVPP